MDQDSSFDPGTRRLCPDGTCIGVLNAEGLCGECRRKFGADAIAAASANGSAQTWAVMDAADGLTGDAPAPGSTAAAAASGSDFDPNRRMCADGSCIGVISASGTCTVCGRVAG